MGAVPFDTLKLATKLEATGFTPEQARGAAAALAESFENSELATKGDIREAAAAARSDLKDFKADLEQAIAGVRADLEQAIAGVRADLASLAASGKADLDKAVADLKETDQRQSGDIQLLKWMLGLVIAGILALVLKAFVPH